MLILPPDSAGIAKALTALSQGLVIVHATETCYGLACDLSNPEAVARLFAIKKRPETQPVSALFATLDQAKTYVLWNERAEKLANEFLPGPLTLVLNMRENTPSPIFVTPKVKIQNPKSKIQSHVSQPATNNRQPITTVGVRLSPHPVALALVTQFKTPISTTSANIHGQENPYDILTILAQYEKSDMKPDYIVDSGTLERRNPSRIIDLTGTSDSILRP